MAALRRSGLTMLAGALVWAAHFMAGYGAMTLVCARGLSTLQWAGIGIVAWTMTVLTALALLALGAIAWSHVRRTGFTDRLAVGVAALAALAIVWEAWLVTRPPPCA
jgi:hypothetical protein